MASDISVDIRTITILLTDLCSEIMEWRKDWQRAQAESRHTELYDPDANDSILDRSNKLAVLRITVDALKKERDKYKAQCEELKQQIIDFKGQGFVINSDQYIMTKWSTNIYIDLKEPSWFVCFKKK